METQQEYYYTYYSYEEWGRGYFGSRGCECLPEKDVKYFGSFSDKNFKPTQKIILKSDYTTREDALADEIILHDYYDVANNPHFANRAKATSTGFYVSKEDAIKNGKIGGTKSKELRKGCFARTPEQMIEDGRKGGTKSKELCKGFFALTSEQKSEISKKGGKNAQETLKKNRIGLYGQTKEQKSEAGKKGGSKGGKNAQETLKKNRIGLYGQTKEQKSEAGKKGGNNTSSQKWKCLETGYISNPPGLSHYQKARGIDTTKRIKIE